MDPTGFDFDRLLSLSKGLIWSSDEEICAALVNEEARMIDALTAIQGGGVPLALRKLNALGTRLLADGHDECEEGKRNLRLLESAARDLSDGIR